jgi:hypothetical protein
MFAMVSFTGGIVVSQIDAKANNAVIKAERSINMASEKAGLAIQKIDDLRKEMNDSAYETGKSLGANEASHIAIQKQLKLMQEQLNRIEDKLYKKR